MTSFLAMDGFRARSELLGASSRASGGGVRGRGGDSSRSSIHAATLSPGGDRWVKTQALESQGTDDDVVPLKVQDMADQKRRADAEVEIASGEVDAAKKIVGLKREVLDAAQDRAERVHRRYEVADAEVKRLEGRIGTLAGEMERYAEESRAKSFESKQRSEAAQKILQAGASRDGEGGWGTRPPKKGKDGAEEGRVSAEGWEHLVEKDGEEKQVPRALDTKALTSEEEREELVKKLEEDKSRERELELEEDRSRDDQKLWGDSSRLQATEGALRREVRLGRGEGRLLERGRERLAEVEGRLRSG